MINNKTGESFVGIIVGVFILSISILGILSLVIYSRSLIIDYEQTEKIDILKNNLSHIIPHLDTTGILENEVFYVHKNPDTLTFDVYTGSDNSAYKYIDDFGNQVDHIETYERSIYARLLFLQRVDTSFGTENQIIKGSIQLLNKK